MVIKRSDEGEKVPDEPFFRGSGPSGANRGPDIPVYVDIPLVTPGGGRADVVRVGQSDVDVFNRGNNPYQVRASDYERMQEILRSERQAAQRAEAANAARQRMVLLTAAPRRRNVSNILNGSIPCLYSV